MSALHAQPAHRAARAPAGTAPAGSAPAGGAPAGSAPAGGAPAGAASAGGAGPLWRDWLVAFCLLFVATICWSLASPLGSGPDEPAHLIRAASLVRGQLVGTPVPDPTNFQKSTVTVRVPDVFASLASDVGCFQFKPAVPAGCQPPLASSTQDVPAQTYVGRYPPLYYAIVGLPTLAAVSAKGVYGARIVSGALSAAMLALAVAALRRCRGAPLLGAGLAVAMTPMVLYLASIVNPTGLEIASAIAAWAGAMALVPAGPAGPSASSTAMVGGPAVVLILVRAMSPLWAAFVAVAMLALMSRASVLGLLRRRAARWWLAGCALASVLTLVWDVAADPFLTEPGAALPAGTSEGHIVVLAFERLDLLVTTSIGFFGWLDSPSPYGVTVAWLAALGAVVLVGICLARLRGALVALGALVAWFVVPVVLAVSQARKEGILGQGRDFMGLAVAIPIVAAFVAGRRFADRYATLRFSGVIIALLAICQMADFYSALRRNMVGLLGPMDTFAPVPGGWHPPAPAALLVVVFVLAVLGLAVMLYRGAALQPAAEPLPSPQPQV